MTDTESELLMEERAQVPTDSFVHFGLPPAHPHPRLARVPVEAICTRPRWWRTSDEADPSALDLLASSVHASSYGVHSPVVLREVVNTTRYEVVVGLRRVLVAQRLGLEFIPARVVTVTDAEAAIMALSSHTTRRDVPLLRMAWGATRIISATGMQQAELARRLGVKPPTVSEYLAIGRALPEAETLAFAASLGVPRERVERLPRTRLREIVGCSTAEERRVQAEAVLRGLAGSSPTSPTSPGELLRASGWRAWLLCLWKWVQRRVLAVQRLRTGAS